MKITDEIIRQAADDIAAAGAKVTQRAVRERLDGGSYTTIGPVLAAWAEARRVADADAAADLPETVSRVMSELAGRVWRVAREEAAATFEVARGEMQTTLDRAAAEREETREVITHLEHERDAAAERAEEASEHAGAVETELATAQAEIVRLEERVAAREREVAQAEARADALREELAEHRRRLEAMAAELATQRVLGEDGGARLDPAADAVPAN